MIACHFSGGEILDGRDELDAGVVDQDIDCAELFGRVLDHRLHFVALGHVGAVVDALDLEFALDLGALFLDRLRVAEAVDHDVGAFPGEAPGDGEADSAGGAGDDGMMVCERHMAILQKMPSGAGRLTDAACVNRSYCIAMKHASGRSVAGDISARQTYIFGYQPRADSAA